MKRGLIAGLVVGIALISCSSALADITTSESLTLDTYSPVYGPGQVGMSGPVSTVGTLTSGKLYAVTVQGTWSAWAPILWTGTLFPAVPCGTPEAAPLFPSPDGYMTGPVGEDSVFVFAAIQRFGCTQTYPYTYNGFQVNTGDGSGFQHYEPFGALPTVPSANHEYTYVFLGQGTPISFQQIDENTTDDYGEYQITVTLGTESCKKGGWQAYGVFKNQGDCVSYFATDGRNPPALLSQVDNSAPPLDDSGY